MVEKYQGGVVNAPGPATDLENKLAESAQKAIGEYETAMKELAFHKALFAVFSLISDANKYVDSAAAWTLAKNNDTGRLTRVMYTLVDVLRISALLLAPFIPGSAQNIWAQLGLEENISDQNLKDAAKWAGFPAGRKINKGPNLFPRIK